MSESSFSDELDVRDADFDALYQGGRLLEGVDFRSIPWDIGRAQPFVVELEHAGRFRGEVLDVGCGLGENAMYLASRGYRVTGLDVAPTAIEQAGQLARQRGVDVEFAVADATRLAGYEGRFDSVLDSACYHCFDEAGRHVYTAALHRATKPGALLNLCCFADTRGGMPTPMNITEHNLRTTLDAAGWRITDLRQVTYLANADVGEVAAEVGIDIDLTPDDTGHLQMPMWALQAHRV